MTGAPTTGGTTTTVAVVGAGVAGLGAAYALRDADADVTVFERRESVGGRAATRRRDECVYDVGANYLKSDSERVSRLVREELADGLAEVEGAVWTFDAEGEISPGRDDDAPKWTYREGVAALGERLRDAGGATVRLGTEVTGLSREDEDWRIETADTTPETADAVVLTPPAPATAGLLDRARWDDSRREALRDEISSVSYRTILTVALRYDRPIDRPFYALVNTDKAHDLGWVAREECKPGHVPDGESLLVVQPSPEWSAARHDDADDEIAEAAADRTADLLDDHALRSFDWADVVRWQNALPDSGADRGALARAADADLFFAGDWVAGEGRLHAALESGLEAGERVADSLT
ncbi:NAD(P)/FAD-dependent oxidoreductase [Halorussus amylolyticus]|uniref:NAD(P)/FAD-dependent oxidoreductase n=1 Tax=Halorussus amylolyticus TaxID=1126242 RepID=UPI001051717D|nr:FAD-dependent oxidoreductase [Halorussus amylolyticus]